ncbi:hypothetical protein SISSUDRAFT_1125832 [Sistotremastrum suecicum HHB10207 ss-3]|uniref:NACHT domain-containing protein n=1 Tax=Sistotremastrum suecicum HHB10207 ss-3 TaxID=1314776 RepID=A0A166GYQ7_9AGAM|nr:hypothetical protein SISSUDRAFT_1125832 [Sistotremastrum suecicum HHB10207 ss-3]
MLHKRSWPRSDIPLAGCRHTLKEMLSMKGQSAEIALSLSPLVDELRNVKIVLSLSISSPSESSSPVTENGETSLQSSLYQALGPVKPHIPLPNINANLPNVEVSSDSWCTIIDALGKLGNVMKLMDAVAQPRLELPFCRIVSAQQEREQNITRLIDKMCRLYEFVSDIDAQTLGIKVGNILEDIVKETTRCANFIYEYCRQKYLKRIVASVLGNVDDQINTFYENFDILQRFLNTGTALESVRLLKGMHVTQDFNLLGTYLKHVSASWESGLCCLPGTRQSLFEDIVKWISGDVKNPEDEPRIFWLTGIAGGGKSAIAHSVAKICSGSGILGSCFFFRYNAPERRSPDHVFTTFATDFASFDQGILEKLRQLIQANPSVSGLERQFQTYILEPLRSVNMLSRAVIVVDGLDECGIASERQEFLRVLTQGSQSLPTNVKLFLTSRGDDDIKEAFDLLPSQAYARRDLNLSSTENTDDITRYIFSECSRIAVKKKGRPNIDDDWPGPHRRRLFLERTAGLFIWASTAFRMLELARNPDLELIDLLKATPTGSGAQDSLDALYKRAIDAIGHWNESGFGEAFRTSMGAVIVAMRPLTLKSIDRLVGDEIQNDRAGQILITLGSVLTGVDSPEEPVKVLHPSFSEFITDSSRCSDPMKRIDRKVHDRKMSVRCLRALCSADVLRRNICDLPDASIPNSKIEDLQKRLVERLGEEIRYSCLYWVSHVLRCNAMDIELEELIFEFLSDHAIHWLEVMSLHSEAPSLVPSLTSLRALLLQSSPQGSDLDIFLRDLIMFCVKFSTVIEANALQIYRSALPFVPLKSPLAAFQDIYHDIPTCRIGLPQAWMPSWSPPSVHEQVYTMAFSQDGTRLGWLNLDGRALSIVDTTPPQTVSCTLKSTSSPFSAMTLSRDGKVVVTGSENGAISQWSSKNGARRSDSPQTHQDEVTCVSFSNSGNTIASGSRRELFVWKATGQQLLKKYHPSGKVVVVAISPNDDRVACVASDPDNDFLLCYDNNEEDTMHIFQHQYPDDFVESLSWADDDTTLLVATKEYLRLISAMSGQVMREIKYGFTAHLAHFIAQGTQLMAQCRDCGAFVKWDITPNSSNTDQTVLTISGTVDPLDFGDAAVDNFAFAAGHLAIVNQHQISFHESLNWIDQHSHDLNADTRRDALDRPIFSLNGVLVAVPTADGLIIWDTETGREKLRLPTHSAPKTCVSFQSRNKFIACGFKDGALQVMGVRRDGVNLVARVDGREVRDVSWHPRGSKLATYSVGPNSHSIHIWDVTSDSIESSKMMCHKTRLSDRLHVVFSSQGDCLATACSNPSGTELSVWNISEGTRVTTLVRALSRPAQLSFLSDESAIWALDEQGTQALRWDFRAGPDTRWVSDLGPRFRLWDSYNWVTQGDESNLFKVPFQYEHPHSHSHVIPVKPSFATSGKLAYFRASRLVLIDFHKLLSA